MALLFGLIYAGRSREQLLKERKEEKRELEALHDRYRRQLGDKYQRGVVVKEPFDPTSDLGKLIVSGTLLRAPGSLLTREHRMLITQALYLRTEREYLIEALYKPEPELGKRKSAEDEHLLPSKKASALMERNLLPSASPPYLFPKGSYFAQEKCSAPTGTAGTSTSIVLQASIPMAMMPNQTLISPASLGSTMSTAPAANHGNPFGALLKKYQVQPRAEVKPAADSVAVQGSNSSLLNLCRAITAFCPLLALPARDITLAQLLALPAQWDTELTPLRDRVYAFECNDGQRKLLTPKIDPYDDFGPVLVLTAAEIKNTQRKLSMTKEDREAVWAVFALRDFCMKWNKMLRSVSADTWITGALPAHHHHKDATVLGDAYSCSSRHSGDASNSSESHEAGLPPVSAASTEEQRDAQAATPAQQQTAAATVLHTESCGEMAPVREGSRAGTPHPPLSPTEVVLLPKQPVPALLQRSVCAERDGSSTQQATPEGDDDMLYYSDIMAAAMF